MARAAILTRPAGQNGRLAAALAQRQIAVLAWPLLQIVPTASDAEMAACWPQLSTFDLVHFASANAIACLHAHEAQHGAIHWKAGAVLAVMGPGSRQALPAVWLRQDVQVVTPGIERADAPSALDSEALLPTLEQVLAGSWAQRRVLQVKGDGGRTWLRDALRARGAAVSAVSVYERRCPDLVDELAAARATWLAGHTDAVWVITSAEGARCLGAMLAAHAALFGRARLHPVLVTHERVAQAVAALGFRHIVQCLPDDAAIVRTIESLG